MRRLALLVAACAVALSAAPATALPDSAAAMGCSNTDRYWNTMVKTERVFQRQALGGGSVAAWGQPTHRTFQRHWDIWESQVPADVTTVWWVPCPRFGETAVEDGPSEMDFILAEMLARRPSIENIYVSALPPWVGDTCSVTTSEWSLELANYIDSVSTVVSAGPVLPDVQNTVDGCHPVRADQQAGAAVLFDFLQPLG